MGMFDGLKRAVGLPTGDIEDAEAMKARMRASRDPSDQFAVALADRLMGYNQDPLARALPEMEANGGRWSRNPEHRWADIARTAHGVAEAIVSQPVKDMDPGLSDAVTRASLESAARSYGGRGPVARHVSDARADLGERVGGMLAGGADAERLAVQNSRLMGHRRNMGLEENLLQGTAEHVRAPHDITRERHVQWLLDSNRAFLAMARTGMLPDDAVVAYARDTAAYNVDHRSPKGRMDRDATIGADTPEARRAIVAKQVEGSIDAVNSMAGKSVSPPFRPVEMTVIPTRDQLDAARESGLRNESDAAWMEPGARRITGRVEGMLVGEKAAREIREAISGRTREGDAWRPGNGTMIPAGLIQKVSMADLQSARTGRLETIDNEALRMTMGEVKRDARQLHHARTHDYRHHHELAQSAELSARNPSMRDQREEGSLIRRSPVPLTGAAMAARSGMQGGR